MNKINLGKSISGITYLGAISTSELITDQLIVNGVNVTNSISETAGGTLLENATLVNCTIKGGTLDGAVIGQQTPITTAYITNDNVTTANITTANITTDNVTTANITTANITYMNFNTDVASDPNFYLSPTPTLNCSAITLDQASIITNGGQSTLSYLAEVTSTVTADRVGYTITTVKSGNFSNNIIFNIVTGQTTGNVYFPTNFRSESIPVSTQIYTDFYSPQAGIYYISGTFIYPS